MFGITLTGILGVYSCYKFVCDVKYYYGLYSTVKKLIK